MSRLRVICYWPKSITTVLPPTFLSSLQPTLTIRSGISQHMQLIGTFDVKKHLSMPNTSLERPFRQHVEDLLEMTHSLSITRWSHGSMISG